jgi:hypothetical protein
VTADQVAAVVAAAVALLGAVTAYLHSRTTRQALRAHVRMHANESISTVRNREEGWDHGRQAPGGQSG